VSNPIEILCVNCGSSSVKVARLLVDDATVTTSKRVTIDGIGTAGPPDHRTAITTALDQLGDSTPAAAGHRVVHGGPRRVEPTIIDDRVLADLRSAIAIAPLHLPASIAGIEEVASRYPGVPQVACFDTAFHRDLPERTRRLALPEDLWELGVRRYGFHGLSYEYLVDSIGATTLGRAVLAHLGNGASLAAVHDGRPVDTTMSFTPTGGIVMGTRSGDLDPGVLVYLVREHGYDPEHLERLVDREAGLLAISGTTSDMRELLEARDRDSRAGLAVDIFCYRIRLQIGAYTAALGGLDTLVFTGGIGEHAAPVRAEACHGLEYLGVELDPERNAQNERIISADDSAVTVRVLTTDEDAIVGRHTHDLLAR
jgi:acetate kinase